MGCVVLPYLNNPHYSGPIQWARGDVGLKPSAAARPGLWHGASGARRFPGLSMPRALGWADLV